MKIAVFCGSRMPEKSVFKDEAIKLAHYLVQENHTMVYGGAKVGIMGIIADEMLRLGGHVVGVMPQILVDKEVIHENLSETHIVDSMSTRKQLINDMSDAFVAYPGGCGTMDEIFEVITLNQINYFNKPCGFVNIDNYYDGIETYLNTATKLGFTGREDRDEILFESDAVALIKKIERKKL